MATSNDQNMPRRSSESSSSQPTMASIQCPRCGYDLRGMVATWTESCPLRGVCSECGLAFEWRAVLVEIPHPWLFEHQWRKRPVGSAVRTLTEMVLPGRFWKKVSMNDRVEVRPALAFSISLVIAINLAAAIALGVVDYFVGLMISRGSILPFAMWEFINFAWKWVWLVCINFVGPLVAWCLFTSAAFVLLPTSLRRAKVLPRHVVRIGIYAMPWFVLVSGGIVACGVLIVILDEWLPRWAGGAATIGLICGPIVTMTWWYGRSCSRYLKLPHSWAVAFLLTILSGLVTFVFYAFVWRVFSLR